MISAPLVAALPLAALLLATLLTAALLTSLHVSAAAAFDVTDESPEPSRERPRFLVDAGTRMGPEGPEVLLAVEIPYGELFFRPVGSRYRSDFDLVMVLYRGRSQVGGDAWSERVEVASFADTRSRIDHVNRVLRLQVPPGRYSAEVLLRESFAGRQSVVRWTLELPDYASPRLSLSSLWVTPCDEPEVDSLPPRDWRIGRRFGEPSGPLCIRGEVYRKAGSEAPVSISWRIVGYRGESLQSGEMTLEPEGEGRFRIRPDFAALWLGRHTIEVEVASGRESARRRFEFQVAESAASLETDLEQSLELIGLIATREEIRELRAAAPTERKEAWNRFWKRRDPAPETPENEFREEFFARVRHANEHFSVLEPGWRSDRGRTWIRYGPPDEVERRPFNLDSPAREIWEYVRLGRRFVFVDYDGFGRYEFYQPGRL